MKSTLRSQYPLCFRKIFKKNIWSLILVFIAWGIGSYFVLKYLSFEARPHELLSAGHRMWYAWVGVLLILVSWITGYETLYFFSYFYDMDKNNVVVRKGVIAQTEVTLPFSKITDVYVDQDIMDVFFGIYDLHISTPTAESGHLAHIDGLSRESAYALKKALLEKINAFGEQPQEGNN